MKQVTREEFYRAMRGLNVHPSVRGGPWPYTSDWKLAGGAGIVVGRTEDYLVPGTAITETRYFLASSNATP